MDIILIYLRGFCFLAVFIALLSSLGRKLNKEKNFPLSFILGYVFYTFLQAVIGIFIQVLHFDRIYYYIFVTLLWCLYVALNYKSLFHIKEKINLLKAHMIKYKMLYVLAVIFTLFAITNVEGLWTSNRLDDGAYLSQIGQSLDLRGTYDINTVTGYSTPYDFIRLVNTFEIEASLYSTLFSIPTTIYLKFILPFLNYFLFVTCVYYLSYFLTSKNHKASLCISSCTLLFALTSSMLQANQLLFLTDDWQFNWAMGYGSSIVRVMGYILVFVPLLKKDARISFRNIIYFIIVSITLMSKATQALPILYISALIYLFIWIHQRFCSKTKYILYAVVCIALCCVPANVDSFGIRFDLVYLIVSDNFATHYKFIFGSIVAILFFLTIKRVKEHYGLIGLIFICFSVYVQNILYAAIILLIFSFTLKNENIRKWNFIILAIGCLMFVPKLNTMFIVLSIYSFVASRAITLYAITLICTGFVYLYFLIDKIQKKEIMNYLTVSMVGVISVVSYLQNFNITYGIKEAFKVIYHNPYLIPQSTLDLQDQLQVIAEDYGKQVDVVMPIMQFVDNTIHFPYVLLRIEAEDVNSVSAIIRYPNIEQSNPLSKYSQADQDVLENINGMQQLDTELVNEFNDILLKYPEIDVVVVQNEFSANALEQNTELKIVSKVEIKSPQGFHYILLR